RAWLRAESATRPLRACGRGAGGSARGGRVRRAFLGDLIPRPDTASACTRRPDATEPIASEIADLLDRRRLPLRVPVGLRTERLFARCPRACWAGWSGRHTSGSPRTALHPDHHPRRSRTTTTVLGLRRVHGGVGRQAFAAQNLVDIWAWPTAPWPRSSRSRPTRMPTGYGGRRRARSRATPAAVRQARQRRDLGAAQAWGYGTWASTGAMTSSATHCASR